MPGCCWSHGRSPRRTCQQQPSPAAAAGSSSRLQRAAAGVGAPSAALCPRARLQLSGGRLWAAASCKALGWLSVGLVYKHGRAEHERMQGLQK